MILVPAMVVFAEEPEVEIVIENPDMLTLDAETENDGLTAAPAYPVQYIKMEDMNDEMKDALIRSVITEKEETKLVQMLYGEERTYSFRERAAVIWHTFNRVDSSSEANSVDKDITHGHYSGYLKSNPKKDWAIWIVRDVAWRYACEKLGYEDVGRVLPKEYCYMAMHNGHNRFRDKYKGAKKYYDWSIPSLEIYHDMEEQFLGRRYND